MTEPTNHTQELLDWVQSQGWPVNKEGNIIATALVAHICQHFSEPRGAMACFAHIFAELLLQIPHLYENKDSSDGKSADR